MERESNIKLNISNSIIKKISFGITSIIMGTILCSGALMHIIVN